ncbi:MAG: HYR domain-containing protein [Saprospiraceae bacterium]|nr:HYR domain-containing protein [Saprospiraceae bacterium]MDW8229820.1 HYR domain-containing protein [Saprospiraceae bacterium]
MNRWIPACIGIALFSAFSFSIVHARPCEAKCFGAGRIAPDTTGPTLICPSDTTLRLAKGACGVVYVYEVLALDGPDTLPVTQLSGLPSGDTFPHGLTQNIFTATDDDGNTVSCAFTVEVKPDSQPIECPPRIVAYLGPQCTAAPRAEDLLDKGYYTCPDKLGTRIPGPPAQRVPAVFNFNDLAQKFQLIVRDSLIGSECLIEVSDVRDTLPPALTCPTLKIPCVVPLEHLTPTFLRDSLGIAAGFPSISENCPGSVSTLFTDIRNSYPCDSVDMLEVIRRFWTVGDARGNFSTCVQVIERVRPLQEVKLPQDTTVACSASAHPNALGWPFFQVGKRRYALGPSAVCGLEAAYSDTEQPLCGGARLLTRLWTVRNTCQANDPNAQPFVGEQVIELADSVGPTVHCPSIVGATLLEDGCSGTVDLPDFVITDACSPIVRAVLHWDAADSLEAELTDFAGADTLRFDTLAVFGQLADLNTGPLPMTLTLYDACDNVGVCEFTLDVRDRQKPIARCDTLITIFLDDKGNGSAPADLFDNGSTDDCRAVRFKVRRTAPSECDSLPRWNDFVRFCCADIEADVVVTLRVYDAIVLSGSVPDSVGGGHYSECHTRVEVLNNNLPRCQAPADVTIACTDFDPTLKDYGDATLSCGVDSVAITLDSTQFSWTCGSGTLLRVFQVFDKNGASGQCTQQITGLADFNYYIKFPDDVITADCHPSTMMTLPIIHSLGCEDVAFEFSDERVNVPEACYLLLRRWKIYNRCNYNPDQPLIVVPNPRPNPIPLHQNNWPGPLVSSPNAPPNLAPTVVAVTPGHIPTNFSTFWNPYGNGYTYEQYIWVQDTEEPVISCASDTLKFTNVTLDNKDFWFFQNLDLCEADATVSVQTFDGCERSDVLVSYRLFLDLDGNGQVESVFPSPTQTPAGSIRYNNINNPNYTGGTQVEFDRRNVPAQKKYQFDIARFQNGDTLQVQLVWRESGNPAFVTPKLPRGIHRIEWTVRDRCGNTAICTQIIQVGAQPYSCAPSDETISGDIRTEQNEKAPGIIVELKGASPLQGPIIAYEVTNQKGEFSFTVPFASTFVVQPSYDEDPVKGVTTLDLLTINRHILNLDLLPTPYRIIAADANSSRTVTTFDILELRKLILGIYTELPASPSWRFVPTFHVFPDPSNPFLSPLPEKISSSDSIPFSFIIIKVGDANASVKFSLHDNASEERQPLYLDVEDCRLNAGEETTLTLRACEAVAGVQGTLECLGLEVLDVLPEAGFTSEHYALHHGGRRLTFSWDAQGVPVLRLRVRALRPGRLSECLTLSDAITPTEAYSLDQRQTLRPQLRFSSQLPARGDAAPKLSSQPNPFGEETWVHVQLPQEGRAVLRVHDVAGRLLWEKTGDFGAGIQAIRLTGKELANTSGVLYFSAETANGRAVHRLVRL